MHQRSPGIMPWDLEGRALDLEGQQHGTLRGVAAVLRGSDFAYCFLQFEPCVASESPDQSWVEALFNLVIF